MASVSDVRNDGPAGDLKKIELLKASYDLSKAGQKKHFQLRVRDVAGRNEQQLAGASLQMERAHEILIFGDQDVLIADGEITENAVRRPIAEWEIEGVKDLEALLLQATSQSARQFSVDQKSHATSGTTRFT
jgi:hypothetical protein